jgi:glycosyltransferase involved in cell wall biosynthesis
MKKYIYYWSPCLDKVGTVKSTLNSALSVSKFSNDFEVKIINVFGEWNEHKKIFAKHNIEIIDLSFNYYNLLPKKGFFYSRLSYIVIILLSIIPLFFLLKKNKPDILIAHLITSLPLIFFNIFNFNTKLILRISGFPKLNYFRKILWKKSNQKLFKVTCPTIELLEKLKKIDIFTKDKLFYLQDAIIDINEFKLKLKEENFLPKIDLKKKYALSIGRLSKQKNFSYLINEFDNFCKNNNELNLIIIGSGEEKNKLNKMIKLKKLEDRIFLINRTENVYKYMESASVFILPSLWEEVGFVMVEAALSNLFIISSNCPNGPSEFLDNGNAGILFKSNVLGQLENSLNFYLKNEQHLENKKIKTKKNCLKYTKFRHFTTLKKILNEN